MILSRSEEETLEEQILDCCVREEWEETEVTLSARTRRWKGEGGPRKRKDSEDAARGFGVVSKRKVLPFLSYVIAVTGALRTRLVASSCFLSRFVTFSVASIYRL